MSDPADQILDAQLRDVPLPDGLLARLKSSLVPSDEQLNAALVAVAVPATVLARLREIPGDVAVDEAVNEVAAPPALIYALRRPTWGQRFARAGRSLARLSVAALWFVAISAALAGGLRLMIEGTYPPPKAELEIAVIYDGPLSVDAQMQRQREIGVPLAMAVPSAAEEADSIPVAANAGDKTNPPIARIAQPEVDEPGAGGPVAQWVSLVSSGLRPMDDAVLLRYGVLGSPHYADDHLPDLIAPRQPRAAGIQPPLVRGYDRAFFLKHRVFPPIAPAANPKLADLDVPLRPGSDALARIESTLAEGRTPEPHDVRVEDLIAAMDYRLAPAPAGRLALRTAAGPAIFGPPESGLLLVGVQAGGLAQRPQPVTHLVVALDLSHSMSRGGRLPIVQKGLSRLLDQLSSRDRISLVVFNEEVVQVVEAASRDEADSIRRLLGELAPRGGTNLAAGLQQAASLAMADAAGPAAARRLVLITDSQATMPDDTRSGIEQLLAAAGAVGVRLDVLDVSQRAQVDATLQGWSLDLGGDLRPIADARQMTRSLLEVLSGREATIARDACLKLHFNPKTVAAYRLVGHEANPLADLTPAAVDAEFAAGEAAAALVE
ncbi:MAG TPA: YfbK domain-containing protein, partial [Pirellulaceae bacterium]|nr:YfbK domain-containing protein [Pirellulaceae bacterium]